MKSSVMGRVAKRSAPSSNGTPINGKAVPVALPGLEDIVIDPRFAALIPPASAGEVAGLERSLLKEGCREPLIVWTHKHILLDGHTRIQICRQHGISFRVVGLSLPDRGVAEAWIVANQLGKRNLSPQAVSYLRGRSYLMLKCQGKRTDLTSGQKNQKWLAQQLADEHRVGEKTVRRDSQFALAVDQIIAHCGPAAKKLLLSRDSGLSRHAVERLAQLPAAQQR